MSNKFKTCFLLLLFISLGTLSQAQDFVRIYGKVSTELDGEPLQGVNVSIQGTSLATTTKADGSYQLNVMPGNYEVVFDYLGYNAQTISTNANSSVEVNATLSDLMNVKLSDMVVAGIRQSQLEAINQKKNANILKEVLSPNELGRLPDINVAEALQRVSGVSIETDAGEGRFISIRGIQPSLVNVTINNGSVGSTSSSRATPLNLLPIEMIQSIEVQKSVTPDMDATAIGGSVNVSTTTAFDKKDSQFVIATVDGMLTDRVVDYGDQDIEGRLALTLGKRFGKDEKFGVVLSGNYYKRDFSLSVLDPDRWQLLKGVDKNGNETPGYLGPNEIEIQVEDNNRKRYGLNADLEYRPMKDTRIYFKSLYAHTDEVDYNSEFELTFEGDLIDQTPTSGRFTAGSGELDLSSGDKKQNLYNFTLGAETTFGRWNANIQGTMSVAKATINDIDGTYENDKDTEYLLESTYDLTNFFFDISPVNLEIASNTDLYNLRSLNIEKDNKIKENMNEFLFDLEYDLGISDITSSIKFGGRFRGREKDVDRNKIEYDGTVDFDELEESIQAKLKEGLTDEEIEELMDQEFTAPNRYKLTQFSITPPRTPVGTTQPYVHGDAKAFAEFFLNPSNITSDNIYLNAPDTYAEIYEDDVNYEENVYAAYAMAKFGLAKLNIVAGARVEHTKATSNPYILDVDEENGTEAFNQYEFENSYTNFLPSINATYKANRNFYIRAAWTNTLGRADYDELSGASEFEFDRTAEGTYKGYFEGSNYDLKPYISNNFDLALEYYSRAGGLITLGGFYKNIKNQIFQNEYVQNDVEFQGIQFEELVFSQYVNLNKAKLYGLEAGFDQTFSFLPSFWNGFGLTANTTLVKSEVTYPGREDEDLPLLRQPDFMFNIIPYYQKYGMELRFAISHRSDYLTIPRNMGSSYVRNGVEAGYEIADFDRYQAARTTMDISAAYTFPELNLKIMGQVRNLTDEAEQDFQGNEDRYDRYQTFGRSYFLGASITF